MAPTKFPIYVDQSMINQKTAQQPIPPPPPAPAPAPAPVEQVRRYKPDDLARNQRLGFDERKIYPVQGDEYSFEELNYFAWMKRQEELAVKRKFTEIAYENEDLRQKLNILVQQVQTLQQQLESQQEQLQAQQQHQDLQQAQDQQQQLQPQVERQQQVKPASPPNHRLSVVPQSLQPATQGADYADMSSYGAFNEAPSIVHDFWKNTLATDKFTVPIDQSHYIRDNVPTSTPTDKNKRPTNRRMSRPSLAGSPTLKLSPIVETSRDCNSKSSSSSGSATPGTAKKPLVYDPPIVEEPAKPVDPHDPTTYCRVLPSLAEPLARRSSWINAKCPMPVIKSNVSFQAGPDKYLVDELVSAEDQIYTAQLLNEDSIENSDFITKNICFKVDQPANEWLFYICDELHKRLVKQKTQPDIELAIMNADPAVIFTDGSILIDEYYRFVTLDDFVNVCKATKRPFPKSVAAYITLELILLVKGIHSCDIIHTNILPRNIVFASVPSKDDINHVNDRISVIKLLGFDRAIDTRLISNNAHDVDWLAVLQCVHLMFFSVPLEPNQDEDGRWRVEQQFKGLPTDIWEPFFYALLNIEDLDQTIGIIERAVEELTTWIKANINFVLSGVMDLERLLEAHQKK